MTTQPAFFGAFNARHTHALQVAESFVPNEKFLQLLDLENAMVVGPRGSGKTTLLKMLQTKALAAWQHEKADEIRSRVPFISVFIPADKGWQAQIDAVKGKLRDEWQHRFELATFVTHVQISLISTFLQLTRDRPPADCGFQRLVFEEEAESHVSKILAKDWRLSLDIPSFLGLRYALTSRLTRLSELPDRTEVDRIALLGACQTTLFEPVTQAIELFGGYVGISDHRWALLFDELEIAPKRVQEVLFDGLRSRDARIILKLAFSPSIQGASVLEIWSGPKTEHDFRIIHLYYDKEASAFCEALWSFLVRGSEIANLRPAAVLGNSFFHEMVDRRYEKGGSWGKAFEELAEKDLSFRLFLASKSINPSELSRSSRELMDAVIRKIAPNVGFRNLLIVHGPTNGRRSELRKGKFSGSDLFSGWQALCLVSEGNPRWFTGIAKRLLAERRANEGKALSKQVQVAVLREASKKFLSYIASTPTSTIGRRAPSDAISLTLTDLVSTLGDVFRGEVLEDEFKMDPVLAFQVDHDCEPHLSSVIVTGLYTGAFIPLDGFDLARPQGGKFRLAHLLAPEINLPLRRGEDRLLSSLLRRHELDKSNSGKTSKRRKVAQPDYDRAVMSTKQRRLL